MARGYGRYVYPHMQFKKLDIHTRIQLTRGFFVIIEKVSDNIDLFVKVGVQ